MRLQSSFPPCTALLLLILLVAGQLAILNKARSINRELESWKSEYYSTPSMSYIPRISPSQEHHQDDNDIDYFSSIHGVSKRLVPQGYL
ncbi:hypothetical protein Cni_G07621 [Canna indica]|uniref:Uncharacterized protein n=1 Tax=Canna indica TaxID=4628 RepID=A0AAQ3K0P0_9LILI|nr:hypothetical protein Cni_G07621 [Canna indica]